MPHHFDTLVLPGGGIKGLTILGALHYLYTETDYLENIETFSGTSIGGIINVFLALGFTPIEIFSKSYHYDKAIRCDISDILGVTKNYGLKSNEHIIDFAFDIILERYSSLIIPNETTLEHIFTITGKTLYFAVANISEDRMVYFNHKSHPKMPLKLAMRMTANIPFIYSKIQCDVSLFTPDRDRDNSDGGESSDSEKAFERDRTTSENDENDYYVDGGLLDNCPISCVDNGVNNVLVVDIHKRNKKGNLGVFEYFYKIITLPAKYSHAKTKNNMSDKCRLFDLDEVDVNLLGINSNLKDRQNVFDQGYEQAHRLVIEMEMEESYEV